MKILFLTRYANMGASSRYRFLQFMSYFKERGADIRCQSFFDDEYLSKKYAGRKISFLYLLKRYLLRFSEIFKIGQYDVIGIEKEIFPSMPIFFEKMFHALNKNWIVDYDDAVQVLYENKPFLKNKISDVIKLSKAVTVANDNMFDYAKKHNARVYLLPDALKENKYQAKTNYSVGNKVVVGWAGSPTTKKFLKVVARCLAHISKETPIILKCIGIDNFSIPGVEVENIKWNEEQEPEIIRNFDVGIMPLTDDAFSRGKSGFKIIQYFASGVPTIASPVGYNKSIIINGENGFLAEDERQWEERLKLLICEKALREKIGKAGRKSFDEKFSFTKISPKMSDIYYSIINEYSA